VDVRKEAPHRAQTGVGRRVVTRIEYALPGMGPRTGWNADSKKERRYDVGTRSQIMPIEKHFQYGSEAEFRSRFLVPLLRRLGYFVVDEYHSAQPDSRFRGHEPILIYCGITGSGFKY
jgi:hypothetical protein